MSTESFGGPDTGSEESALPTENEGEDAAAEETAEPESEEK